MIMGLNQSLHDEEAQNDCYTFVCASTSSCMAIINFSDKGLQLDKEWEENDYCCLNLNGQTRS
jgi:hypothetical protein